MFVGFVNDPACPATLHSESSQGKKHKPAKHTLNAEIKSESASPAKLFVSDQTADSENATTAVKRDAMPAEVPKKQRKVISLDELRPGMVQRGKTSRV